MKVQAALKAVLTPCDCPNLCNWVFDKFVLADKFVILQNLETCVLVSKNWCKKYPHY